MKCCLCGNTGPLVNWCNMCEHFYCAICRGKFFPLGMEEVIELTDKECEGNHVKG